MDGRFNFYDTTFGVLRRRFGMLGNNICTFNQYFRFIRKHFQHLAWFFWILVVTSNHHDIVAFFNIELRSESVTHFVCLARHARGGTQFKISFYNTSGAREMIFMYPLSRNSLATGPKIRVPRGSSDWFNSTTALSSKRI